jgi:hypothetical protein
MRSGSNAAISATALFLRTLSGCTTGTSASSASSLMRGGRGFELLPTGRSGCVTSPTNSPPSATIRKEGSAISPVPMNKIRI